ncbi:hypothetical protein Pmani_036538 [Petrolisthes manimaculis]|uniref:Uncharacterized protein n=1 Tax=Petrolisthes manimaculis TaxID=1843537 RepID=A0AAE1TPB2_9EUCA|nr:hypothetical protein Pmani_036538 [Petrolisthes manimaculis]
MQVSVVLLCRERESEWSNLKDMSFHLLHLSNTTFDLLLSTPSPPSQLHHSHHHTNITTATPSPPPYTQTPFPPPHQHHHRYTIPTTIHTNTITTTTTHTRTPSLPPHTLPTQNSTT